jgi:hypothetical protein
MEKLKNSQKMAFFEKRLSSTSSKKGQKIKEKRQTRQPRRLFPTRLSTHSISGNTCLVCLGSLVYV